MRPTASPDYSQSRRRKVRLCPGYRMPRHPPSGGHSARSGDLGRYLETWEQTRPAHFPAATLAQP